MGQVRLVWAKVPNSVEPIDVLSYIFVMLDFDCAKLPNGAI